jgi:steroid delta-isomerase-like uncharacterized protein
MNKKIIILTILFNFLLLCAPKADYSEQSKIFVDQYYQFWNEQNVKDINKFFSEDAVYRDLSQGKSYIGKKEITSYMNSTFSDYSELNMKALDVISQNPNKIVIQWMMNGKDSKGEKFEFEGTSILELKDGKIIKNSDYYK